MNNVLLINSDVIQIMHYKEQMEDMEDYWQKRLEEARKEMEVSLVSIQIPPFSFCIISINENYYDIVTVFAIIYLVFIYQTVQNIIKQNDKSL